MADFSFDDFLGPQEPEQGNANTNAESDFSFDDFLGDEPTEKAPPATEMLEQPSAVAPAAKESVDKKPPTLLQRLAGNDMDGAIAEWKRGTDESNEIMFNTMGQPIGKKRVSRQDRSDEDALAGLAKEAGIEDWQVNRICSEAKSPEEMREALAYVAGNRQRQLDSMPKEEEKKTGLLRSVVDIPFQVMGQATAGTMTAIGTALGGRSDAAAPDLVDDPMAKNEGETFDHWYKRVGVNPMKKQLGETGKEFAARIAADGEIRKNAERFFKWEAPIAGKEGMRLSGSLMAGEERRNQLRENAGRWGSAMQQLVGDTFVQGSREYRKWLDKRFPVGNTGNGLVDWAENAATGIGQFMFAGATMIPISAAESYQQTRDAAIMSGKSESEAKGIAASRSVFDGAMTAAFYVAPFRRWANGKNITPIEPVKNFTHSELVKASGRLAAKKMFLDHAIAGGEASAIMGAQGAGDAAFDMLASGLDVDLGEIVVRGAEGVRDGFLIGAILGAAHIANARIKGAKMYDANLRTASETPQGRMMIAQLNPDGMMRVKAFLENARNFARKNAKPAADFEAGTTGRVAEGRRPAPTGELTPESKAKFKELCNEAGIPADAELAARIVYDPMVSRFLGERAERTTKISDSPAPETPVPSEDVIDAETGKVVPASEVAAKAYQERFGKEPVLFSLPTTPDGKPALTPFSITHKVTGKTYDNVLAYDSKTGITVAETEDGSYVVIDARGDSDDAATLQEAAEKANLAVIKDQYTAAEREEKAGIVDDWLLKNPPSKPVMYVNSMEEAIVAARAAGFDPRDIPNFKGDAPFVEMPDGTTVLILDNLDNPAEALSAIDFGTSKDRGAFANGVQFETQTAPDADGNVVETKVATDKVHGVSIVDGGDGTFVVYDGRGNYAEASSVEEAVAVANGAKPKVKAPKKVKEEKPDETGAGADEASVEAQGAVERPAGAEAARPAEAEPPRAEAPREGVVEPPTTVEGLRDASDNATRALQEAEGRLSKWLEEHPRQVTDDGRTTYGNGGTVREFRELEAAVDAAREKMESAETEYRKAKRAENAEREKIAEQKKSDAKARREQERQKWREENPVTAQLNDISKNTLLPAENALEDLLDSESATNEQKAEAWRKVKAAEKVIADFKEQHKEELAKEEANRKAKEKASQPAEGTGAESPSVAKPPQSAESAPTTAPKPTEAQTPTEPAKPVETASDASVKPSPEDEAKAAAKKAKREETRKATLERANAVPPPDFLGKNAGPKETRVKAITDYLADKNHNRASLHRAIQAVREYVKKHGSLALSDADKTAIAGAIGDAQGRLEKLKKADQQAFAERNAEIPRSLLQRYVGENRADSLLARLLERGFFFVRPRSAVAAKKAAGIKNTLVDAKYDGKLFDPDAEGADELNHFFDGMKGAERDRWLRILFGKDTKSVSEPVVTGNDAILEEMGLTMNKALDAIRKEVGEFQQWRESGAEDEEARHYRELYEEEQAALDEEFGPIEESYAIQELEARKEADAEYANAKAFVYNQADGNDFAIVTPSALAKAEEGDIIQFDHLPQFFSVLSYDAENGILTVLDATGENPVGRAFRVTENDISEIKRETKNDKPAETRTSDARADDARGPQARRGSEASREGEDAGAGVGSVVRASEGATGTVSPQAAQYRTVAASVDRAWQEAHPDEVAELLKDGINASAVASNPNVKGTDKVSWPVTATRISNREDAANIFRLLSNPDYEISKVLYLDEDGNILDSRITHVGVIGETSANISDIIANAPGGTYGVVFSHNHPAQQGNKVKSSPYDDATTLDLKAAVEKAGLKLLDHIITDHNAYHSYGGTKYVSDGAEDFWEKAQALGEFLGEAVEKPDDTMNLVPYDERIDITKGTQEKLNALAALASKAHDKSSWIVGVDDAGRVAFIASFPKDSDAKTFLAQHHGGGRFAILNGENAIDLPAFVRALGKNQAVIAIGENGKLVDFKDSTQNDLRGLNDKILSAASKPAAPTENAPRITNAPTLTGDAQKAGLDLLDELGGFLKAPVAELYAPVEPLDREEFKKLRDVAERLMDHLAAQGYGKFEDMMRFVAANRPDVYERLKDPLRRAWNMNVLDPADEITFARGNEIFGKIDTELNRETTNDLGTDASTAGQRDGTQDNGGERNRTDRGLSVPAGTGNGSIEPGTRRPGGGERPAAPVRDGAGGLPADVREDDRQRGGDGGDAVGQRAVGYGQRDGGHGEVQRDSEGIVSRVGEEVSPGFTAYEPPSDLPVAAPKSQSLIVEPSALAGMPQPLIKSKPDIPDSIPKDGVLQAHQYEAVCRAVDSQNKTLPDGRRQGYFVGDGTGAGKTRIIAGIMLDAMNRKLGKGKAVILSKNKDLYEGALDDFKPFGIDSLLFDISGGNWQKELAKHPSRGIAFLPYSGLAENYAGTDGEGNVRSAGKRGKTLNRYEEIVKWLGKDFDGVIALDEAHSAAKDDGTPGQQAKRSQAVIDLQNAFPNARILYLTATAAYDAEDLRFLTRMGLWGEGAGFRTFNNFADAVNRGGLSMMEILTQSMKAAGKYCSRSISFKGVNCKRVVANVTPEQKQTYADYSSVLSRIHDVAMSLEGVTGAPRKYLSSQYFGRALDLFNSLITSMKVGKAIELGKQAIAEGKSPVFQLISTNDSAKKAKKAAVPTRKEYDMFGNVIREVPVDSPDEVEANVKDRIINYLRGGGFPVREYLGKRDGHMQWGEVMPQAVALRDETIALVSSLPDVGNPIDEIVKAFQGVGISRITGESDKNAEAAAFNDGKNLALVFSGAGGTGASYHADKRFKNQRQRVQIPIEFGWEPDKFLQALGRSHRNNQVVPPEFVLLTTDIAGEMRFMSTIANRVASMGAIVGGDRNSSGQVVSSGDSVQNKYGSDAINDVKRKLGAGQRIGEMYADEVLDAMFVNPDKLDDIKPSQFLGRLQFLPVDEQSAIYGEIASQMERAIAKAKADGTFDDGIRKIDAKRVVVQNRESMSTGENEGQNRDLLTVSEWYDSPRIDHAAVETRVPEGQRIEYVRNRRSGKLYALISRSDGAFARLAPNGSYETVQPLERANYTTVDKEAGRKAWDEEYAKVPAEEEKVRHYMSGDLIPVWDKIGIEGRPYVYRSAPAGAKPFIGLYISDVQLSTTLYGFGKKDEARKFFKENAYRLVAKEGAKVGIGAKDDMDRQPYFRKMKHGLHNVLAAFQVPDGSALEEDFMSGGWQGTWARDENNYEDRGGQVYYRDFGEDAEAALNSIIDRYGSVEYRGNRVAFESKDGIAKAEAPAMPVRSRTERGEPRTAQPVQTVGVSNSSVGERVGMPQMRMRVQNGELIITNTDSRHKDDLKLAFGGEWANRVRDGRRYVKSDLRWNKDPVGRGGWWSIPLDKVPADIRNEIEAAGLLRSPVAPLESVADMERSGGVARLAANPDEFKATFVYNVLRSPVAALEGNRLAPLSEGELIRRAVDEGDMAALGELYNRYMKPNAAKGGLKGLVMRAAARKGMSSVINDARAEEVASLVWAGTPVDGGYENNRRGIIADFNKGDIGIYRSAKSLVPAMTAKIDRILNDMAERSANRPEMLTLDRPSTVREGESELDQQIADNPDITGEVAAEFVDPDETAEDVIARKLGDVASVGGSRRLTPEESNRLNAMDMLDETMFFLPEELQDVINAVLTEERKRGYTDKGAERVARASLSAAQQASGLTPRVFGYRYRTAKDLLNEIWRNIRSGKADENIAIRAGEIEGLDETDAELNDEIVQRIEEREPTSDMGLAIRLLLDGHAVADVADFFEVDPALIRAWKARARNEQGVTFPGDEAENTLGLGDFPERKPIKRGKRAGKAARPRQTAWTPDLFAAASATVNDVQNDKIADGIAAGATDEQIAEDAGVDKVIVKLAKIRRGETYQGTLWDEGALRSPVAPLEDAAEAHSRTALADIAAGKSYGVLHNPKYGEIRYPLGRPGKGGEGFLHIVEHRMNGGASLDDAIDIAIKVGKAAEIGEETLSRYNTHHLDSNGVRAIIAEMPDHTKVITGYEIDVDETAAANRRAAELAPRPHVSSEEVIEHLRRSIAQFSVGRNGETLSDAIKTATGAASIGESARPVGGIISQGGLKVNNTLRAPVASLDQGTLGIESGAVEPPYGYTNAAMNEWRAEHGFDEIAKKAKVSLDELHRRGAAMANNAAEMERMVERLSRAPYAVDPVSQVALGQYIVKMENAYEDKTRKKREAATNGNEALAVSLDMKADEILTKLDAAQRINNRVVGNQLGLAMRARQLTVNKDGSLADYMVSCIRAKGGSLTKGERAEAERIYEAFRKAGVEFDEATMQDIVAHIDAISKARLAAQHDEVKERKAKRQVEKIERDYFEALAQIRFHGEKRSGGVLHGLPDGQKWIRALETYHLLNGEGLTDGKPDAAKMVELVLNDILGQGVEATAWDVRQMESRMGNLIRPSQDEISKSLRDLHSQMLVTQQIEHMLETGEMPPKTGFDRDKESAAVRMLRRERDRTMRSMGIERKTADELIASALEAYKTRLKNQIEDNEKAIADIEAGRPYEKEGRRKIELDEEAQSLKQRNDDLKRRIAELTRDPAKEHEMRVMRAMDALAKTIAVRKEQIAAIQAGTFDFDAKRPKLEDSRLNHLRNELKSLNEQKNALKKALFPFGTDAEIERRMVQREAAAQRSLDRWNAMAAEYAAATSWEDRAKAVAPSARVKFPESNALREKRKLRDAARAKVAEYRKQLEREDTRGENARQWARALSATPVLLRTMLDMSVGMVQGGRYMLSHPLKWSKTAYKATKAFLTQKWADQLADEIRNDPYFEDFKAHGGHLYNMEGLDAEIPEDFRALETGAPLPGGRTFSVSKIPGVKRSARSFAGFLDKAGLDLYRSMVEACGENGEGATDNVKKDIARFVNTALGYGYSKSKDEKGLMRGIMLVMDAMAWAPRKAIAELKYATGYDALIEPWLGTRRHEKSGAEIRRSMKSIGREKMRYLLGSLAFGICGLILAKALNGDDDDDRNRLSDILDPRSADFGRIRIGNTSFSFLAGSEMVWRLIARLVSGQSKVNGVVIEKNRADVVGQYLRGKANPLLGLAWDLATGKDYLGNEMGDKTVGKLVRDYAIPLTWSAEYENFAMNDPLTAVVNALPVFYGGAKSTYERDPLERVVAQGDEAKRRAKAAAEAGDEATKQRILAALDEREAVYGAAKGVKNLERKVKQARDKGASDADVADAEKNLAEAREAALRLYRENRKFKWDDMGWAE